MPSPAHRQGRGWGQQPSPMQPLVPFGRCAGQGARLVVHSCPKWRRRPRPRRSQPTASVVADDGYLLAMVVHGAVRQRRDRLHRSPSPSCAHGRSKRHGLARSPSPSRDRSDRHLRGVPRGRRLRHSGCERARSARGQIGWSPHLLAADRRARSGPTATAPWGCQPSRWRRVDRPREGRRPLRARHARTTPRGWRCRRRFPSPVRGGGILERVPLLEPQLAEGRSERVDERI